MSATGTSAPALPTALIYPIVQGIAEAYKTPVTFLVIHTVLGAMLVPLLIALFTLSRGGTRRSRMFVSVVVMVLLGVLLAVWNGYVMVRFSSLYISLCLARLRLIPLLTRYM
jgi:predicted Na+-dependent transporter